MAAGAFGYILTLRLIPLVPFWMVNVAAGLAHAPPGAYVLATFIGIMPATFIYSGIGSGIGSLVERGDARPLAQGGGSLGERLARVVKRLPPGPVVILGSDLPAITRADVAGAFARLGGKVSVLGPASDGGYWLTGLRRRPRLLLPFKDVRWSTRDALGDTIANLNGAPYALLDLREDVDDAAALRRFVSRRRTCARRSRTACQQAGRPTRRDP